MIYKEIPENYSAANIISYNAIYNFINTTRNYGKTWGFKRRAVVRARKLGKRTLWLRRFEDEANSAAATFFQNPELCDFCGVSLYSKEGNPNGNVKQKGKKFYLRRGKSWYLFLQVACLSDVGALRGADDVQLDTIVFDEYTTTMAKYRLYRGDEVHDLIDIFISMRRRHRVFIYFLGNKESVINPYFNYFNIKPLPTAYTGIRTYRGGSIAVEQIDVKEKKAETAYDKKLHELFKGTAYGGYLYEGQYKTAAKFRQATAPPNATLYGQFSIKNTPLRIRYVDEEFYLDDVIDTTYIVYCDTPGDYARQRILSKKLHRNAFRALELAIADDRISYNNMATYEKAQGLYCWLGATK